MRWWHIEPAQTTGSQTRAAYLHRGDCTRYRPINRGFTRDGARQPLRDQQFGTLTLRVCPACRPDLGLT